MRESPMFSGKRLGVVWVTTKSHHVPTGIELAGCKRLFAKQFWTRSIRVMPSDSQAGTRELSPAMI